MTRSPGVGAAPRRILLVEDDDDARASLAGVLANAGHEVTTASDGAQAIERMRSLQPDVVLFDLVMPVMDGWQFRIEQKREPMLSRTPVIALSASDTPQAKAVDADAFLAKPVQAQTLLRTIDEVLAVREHLEVRAERLHTERLAALGTLVAGLAHEINNPLTYVLLHLGTAQRVLDDMDQAASAATDQTQRLRALIDAAIEGGERIRGITTAIRSFGRRDEATMTPLDLRGPLEAAIRLVDHELRHRATLIVDHQDAPAVLANEGRLAEVFLNLLTNAVQAIPEGDVSRNEIRVTTFTDPDGNATVTIADTGCGIPERLLGRIFEPFFSTKPVGTGHGLGLSISHGIVTSLGGTLTVDSELGRGTMFRVTLPPLSAKAESAPLTPRERQVVRRRRVLIIDDEVEITKGLALELSHEHEVVAATSGREALALLAKDHRFDAILCDLHMPELSGIELITRICLLHPGLSHRIIVMTGGAFTDRSRDLLAREQYPMIMKPIDVSRLRSLLATEGHQRSLESNAVLVHKDEY